jgi:hypothetical protein
MKFGAGFLYEKFQANVSFVKAGTVTAVLNLGA